MASISSISQSGMNAALMRMQASAQAVANQNLQTAPGSAQAGASAAASSQPATGFTSTDSAQSSLSANLVGIDQTKNAYLANLSVFRAGDQMMGTLLDLMP